MNFLFFLFFIYLIGRGLTEVYYDDYGEVYVDYDYYGSQYEWTNDTELESVGFDIPDLKDTLNLGNTTITGNMAAGGLNNTVDVPSPTEISVTGESNQQVVFLKNKLF